VLHLEIRDPDGGLWKLATQDAEWSPSDPSRLIDRSVKSADLDEETGELRLALSDASSFNVVPAEQATEDDPPNWKLFTPQGLVLVFGPGGRWHFNRADEPPGVSLGPELPIGNPGAWKSEVLTQVLGEKLAAQLLLEQRAEMRNEQLFLVLAMGLSIISIAVAAVSLALTLQ